MFYLMEKRDGMDFFSVRFGTVWLRRTSDNCCFCCVLTLDLELSEVSAQIHVKSISSSVAVN